MKIIDIAVTAHEVNRAYCKALGDDSQLPWTSAPDWQKESAINGVEFHINNPGASPSASHDAWLKQKRSEGWTYGPVKDVEKKQHPCFVEYSQLPKEQQAKDFIFSAVVENLKGYLAV